MKYIDADLLRKEIKRRIEILKKAELDWAKQGDTETSVYFSGKSVALDEFTDVIDSLQQEQSGEVDLEKEIETWIPAHISGGDGGVWNTKNAVIEWAGIVARHFYELGQQDKYQQDRAEFAKLKAKEWQDGYDDGYQRGLNARKEE